MKNILIILLSILIFSSCSNEVSVEPITNNSENNGTETVVEGNEISPIEDIYFEINNLIDDNKIDKARELLLKNKNDNFEYYKLYMLIEFKSNNYEEAISYGQKALGKEGFDKYDIYYYIGVFYENLGNREKSREFLVKSLELKPNYKSAKDYLNILDNN